MTGRAAHIRPRPGEPAGGRRSTGPEAEHEVGTCTWAGACRELGVHPVWTETRPGLIIHLNACSLHLPVAIRHRYRTDAPPIPAPPHFV